MIKVVSCFLASVHGEFHEYTGGSSLFFAQSVLFFFSDFKCSSWSPHAEFGHTRQVSFQHPIKIYFGTNLYIVLWTRNIFLFRAYALLLIFSLLHIRCKIRQLPGGPEISSL